MINLFSFLRSYKILDLAKAIAPEAKINIIGTRPGEKIHEELITESESGNAVELKKYFVILTSLITDSNDRVLRAYWNLKENKKIKKEFSYKSNTNNDFLSVENIKKLIKSINY